jgi:DNA-binding response OmpR family regulator
MAKRVLVVDDHPPTIQLIRAALEEMGLEVSSAGNGAEGLLAIRQQRPDLVILDVMMPVMDGFQTVRVLRQDTETADLPVILLTARSADEDVARGWSSGASCYLTKPFEVTELTSLVKRMLEGEAG